MNLVRWLTMVGSLVAAATAITLAVQSTKLRRTVERLEKQVKDDADLG